MNKLSTIQSRQIEQQFVTEDRYLSYELGQAVKKLPPLYTRFLAGGISVILVSALSWAYFSKVDEVAVTQGKLAPAEQMRPVRSLDAGSITDVKVKVGDRVAKDDTLIDRDSTLAKTDIARLQKSARLIREDIKRLDAERRGKTSVGISLQDQLLASRLQDFEARYAAAIAEAKRQKAVLEKAKIHHTRLEENLANARINLTNAQSQLANSQTIYQQTQASLAIAQEEEKSLQALLAPGAVAKLSYLDAKNRLIRTKTDITRAKNEIAIARDQITQTQDKIISLEKDLAAQTEEILQAQQAYQAAKATASKLISERQSEIIARLNQRQEELTKIEGELATATKNLGKETIKAPIAGTIYNVKASLGPVQGGEELLSILPEGEEIIFEAHALNRDIGFIAKGMKVKVKLATFPFQEFGTIDGEVVDISADAIADEKLGLIFPVKVKLKQQSIRVNGDSIDLLPGMSATGDIVTRQKSILAFLIEPVARRLSEAFSVR